MTDRKKVQADAFVDLVEKHKGILYKVSRAYCPQPAQRQDLFQEMTAALWRSFDRYDRARPFSTWMYRIALNVAISFYRSESRHASRLTTMDEAPALAEQLPVDPRVTNLLECIDDLDPFDKALVLLHLDGYAHAEIAATLGITTTNAATKLGRIKERLRRSMTETSTQKEKNYGTR